MATYVIFPNLDRTYYIKDLEGDIHVTTIIDGETKDFIICGTPDYKILLVQEDTKYTGKL